jgi:hypothetical protein
MAADDERYYMTFYGFELTDWPINFGSFSNHTKLLDTDYVSEAATYVESSAATHTHKFLYPHHIKKKFFIEGVSKGHVTFAASQCTATIEAYRVSICKINQVTLKETELFTTDWVTTSYTLEWNSIYSVGEEKVFPFWIDCWEHATIDENERIYVKVETDTSTCTDSSCNCMALMHSNDAEWEDLKIEIPFRL